LYLYLQLLTVRKLANINSDISVLADELGYGLFGELDYTLEAANTSSFEASLRHLPYVKTPRTLPNLTRKRVLTMEWITGYRPMDLQLIAEGNDLDLDGSHASIDHHHAKYFLDDLVSCIRPEEECSVLRLGVAQNEPCEYPLCCSRNPSSTLGDQCR
jgi:aarF domain-containing kinase